MDAKALAHQIPIVPVAQAVTKLTRCGSVYRGGCPCCAAKDKKQPFLVDPAGTGGKPPHFHCFSCGAHGDVFNLWLLKTEGRVQIERSEFRSVVRRCAAEHGITVEEDRPRDPRQAAAEQARSRVLEAWGVAGEWLTRALKSAPEAAEQRAVFEALGGGPDLLDRGVAYVPDDGARVLSAHLDTLGVDPDTRARAGLAPEDLAELVAGPALLRRTGAGKVGLSQPQPTGMWVHTGPDADVLPDADRVAPAFVSATPRGKASERILVVVPDLEAAVAVTSALRDLAADDTHPAHKLARCVGVAVAGAHDPAGPESYAAFTPRAVVLLPTPDQHPKETYRHAARLVAGGVMVRVAAWPQTADGAITGVAAVQRIAEAPDFFDWHWRQLAASGVAPGSPEAAEWVARRVQPLVSRASDPIAEAVLTHRACRAAGVSRGTDASATATQPACASPSRPQAPTPALVVA